MKQIPSYLFLRHFMSLFSEIKNFEIKFAIFDLLVVYGNGSMTSTLVN